MIPVYKVLTYLLMPVALLLGLATLTMLGAALSSPAALLPLFTMGATVIYILTSFNFMQKAITRNQACKARLKDWVKVNAFVALFVAVSSLVQAFSFLVNPAMLKPAIDQASQMIKQMPNGNTVNVPQIMRLAIYISLGFGVVLMSHVSMSLILLKKYRNYFVD